MLDSDPNLNISLQSLPKGTKEEERKKCEVQGDGFFGGRCFGNLFTSSLSPLHFYVFIQFSKQEKVMFYSTV